MYRVKIANLFTALIHMYPFFFSHVGEKLLMSRGSSVVEQGPEKPCVGSSILLPGTIIFEAKSSSHISGISSDG